MSCPHQDRLLLDELGELTRNESGVLEDHLARCPGCRERRAGARRLVAEVSEAARAPSPDGPAFVRRVVTAARAPGAANVRSGRSHRFAWPTWTLAAAAIALLAPAALLVGARREAVDPGQELRGTVTARGGASQRSLVRAEVLLVRDGQLVRMARQSMRDSDAFAVRVTNASSTPMHLIAFARDAAGEVHWLYPAYEDPNSDPNAVVIQPGTRDRLMSEVVQPEGPAPGPLQIVTLMSPESLTVKAVESRLRNAPRAEPPESLFSGTVVERWTATWGKRP